MSNGGGGGDTRAWSFGGVDRFASKLAVGDSQDTWGLNVNLCLKTEQATPREVKCGVGGEELEGWRSVYSGWKDRVSTHELLHSNLGMYFYPARYLQHSLPRPPNTC